MLVVWLALAGGAGASAQQPAAGAAGASATERLMEQASAARESNDVPRAIALYRQATQVDPQYADAWWFLGFLSYAADDYAGARSALSHFIDLKPPAGPAMALRGLCEFETRDYEASLADIDQAIALGAANQPRNEQILRTHQGLLLTRAGKFERAMQSYLLLAHEGVNTPAVTLGLGMAGLRIAALPEELPVERQEVALAAGEAALQVVSAPPAAAGAGASPGAEAFAAFFARYPTEPEAHYLYGYLLFAAEPEAAVAQFEQELAVDRPASHASAPAHAMVAWAALMRGDPQAALGPASDAVSADATLPLGQLVLGRALLETGASAAGTQHLEMARKLEPDNLETHLALARAYSTTNHPDEARRERLLCLQLTEDHAARP